MIFLHAQFSVLNCGLLLAIFLTGVHGTPAAAEAPAGIERVTISSVDRFVQNAYPSLARLADDRLLCVFSARGKDTRNKLVVAASFSDDHGRTWGEPSILIDTPSQHDYDPSIVVIGQRIIVTSTATPVGDHSISVSRTVAVRSDDNGRSWSKPYDIPMGRRYTSGKVNNGLVLRDGTAVLGYNYEPQLETVERLDAEGQMIQRSAVMISHDDGRTWTSGQDAAQDDLKLPDRSGAISGICEPAIAECSDGSLYMLARTGLELLYESRSTDNGRSWSKPVPSPLTSHNSPASLCSFRTAKRGTGFQPGSHGQDVHATGILVVWNNSPTDRWPLSVAASFDDARSWTPPKDIALTPGYQCSYPGCIQAADGKLVVVWQQDTKEGREVLGVRFAPEWLAPQAEPRQQSRLEPSVPSWPERSVRSGPLKVTLGPTRIIIRGPMFPRLAAFSGGSIVLTADAAEEGGETTAIRSVDRGNTWRPIDSRLTQGAYFNCVELDGGRAMGMAYATEPIPGEPGWYRTTRFESHDLGLTAQGPLTDGKLYLPPEQFDPELVQWFHGNILLMPDGRLLAAMQGRHSRDGQQPFRSYVAESDDDGHTWRLLSMVASLDSLSDHEVVSGAWRVHGPCEPNIIHLGENRLLCVMRLVNDDRKPPIGPPSETYRDLSHALTGADIYPGVLNLKEDAYYSLGQPSVPLLIARSDDGGRTWSPPEAMKQARGCFPRMARTGKLLALTYGGLTFPRWGNCITFSLDDGGTWTEEINFGPFFTTGYTDIVTIGPNRFLCVFDCTPPQPWKNHAAHWVGAVDVRVDVQEETVPRHAAINPLPRPDPSWVERQERLNARVAGADVDLIFLGDSITHRWEENGKDIWQQYYAHRNAVNLGIDGDGTQTVLWRIENGNINGIGPKVAVVMIGTNNSTDARQSPEQIAEGITAIVARLRERLPRTKVLVLGIFPRGATPTPERRKGAEASRIASWAADGDMVHYLDIGANFLGPQRTISPEIMPDYLHLSAKGYEIWARSMEPKLAELLAEPRP